MASFILLRHRRPRMREWRATACVDFSAIPAKADVPTHWHSLAFMDARSRGHDEQSSGALVEGMRRHGLNTGPENLRAGGRCRIVFGGRARTRRKPFRRHPAN